MIKKIILFGLCLSAIWLFFHLLHPDLSVLSAGDPGPSALMGQRQAQAKNEGRTLRIRRRWVGLKKISPYLVQAVLIAEDDKFFSHHGFDFGMIQNAVLSNWEEGRIKYGASTITQQLAKNLYLSPRQSFYRKLQEAVLAFRMEMALDKPRILELYLNLVEWGPGIFGAEAAARFHFGVSAGGLSPRQAASLAAALPSPRRFSPARPSEAMSRRIARLLAVMAQRGYGKLNR